MIRHLINKVEKMVKDWIPDLYYCDCGDCQNLKAENNNECYVCGTCDCCEEVTN